MAHTRDTLLFDAAPVLVTDDCVTWPPLRVTTAASPAATLPLESPHDVSDLDRIKIERLEMTVRSHNKPQEADAAARAASALELKRLRNRECMRRSRNRKMGELASMKTEIEQLEQQLRDLELQRATGGGPVDDETQQLLDALQRENFALRDELREKDKLRDVLGPLLEQEEQRITLDEQQRAYEEQRADQFAWLRHVTPILKLKTYTPADIAQLVRQSCDEIVASASQADTAIESPNRVFGWSDKRIVDDHYVRFMFSKDFAHQSIDEVTAKSWETSSDLSKVIAFQPREQHMHVLQRWGENAVVVARNLNVPQRCSDGSELERNYCSVILIFRLQTPTGFVVGTRTLEAERVQHALLHGGEYRATYVDLCYGLLFTPLHADASAVGCNVRFGGRAGNGTRVYAQICAMDVLLATLRWENHCIAPLNRLAPTPSR